MAWIDDVMARVTFVWLISARGFAIVCESVILNGTTAGCNRGVLVVVVVVVVEVVVVVVVVVVVAVFSV